MKRIKITTMLGLFIIISIVPIYVHLNNQSESETLPIDKTNPTTKLRVAIWDYEVQKYDQELFDKFCLKNPDIEIEVLTSPITYYYHKLNSWIAGNEQVDVVFLSSSFHYKMLIKNKALQPLDRFMKKEDVIVPKYDGSLKYNHLTYGIPYRGDWFVLYYNKDLFDQLQVPYPSDTMTWEQYRQLGKRLTRGHGNDKTYGIQMDNLRTISEYIIPKNTQGKDFDYLYGDLEKIRRGLENFLNIQNVDRSAIDYNTGYATHSDQRYFELGKTAMFINGTWFANYLKEDKNKGIVKFNWGIAKLPRWEDENPYTRVTVIPVCMTTKCESTEAAWRFIEFITSEKSAELLTKHLIMPAILTESILDGYVNNLDFPKDSSKAILDNELYYEQIINDYRAFSVEQFISREIERALMNNQTVDQTMSKIETFRREVLNNN